MAVPTTQVRGHSTAVEGLILFDVSLIEDDRGWFQERFHKAKLVAAGLPEDFSVVQNSVTFNKRGTTRGFHAEPWGKYVSVMNGTAFCAFLDLRSGSTYGNVVTTTIDREKAVFIPSGVANAYQCLSDGQYYLYSVDAHWTEDAYARYHFVNLADPQVGVHWPIPLGEALLSERDRNHPFMSDVSPIASESRGVK